MATIAEYETNGAAGGILKPGRWLRLRITAWMIALFLAVGMGSGLTYALIRKTAGNGMAAVLGHPVESRGGITESEGQRVVQSLTARKDHRS